MIRDYVRIREIWAKNQTNQYEKILNLLRKRVLKQAFKKIEELQTQVVLLSNLYSNTLNDFVNNLDKKNII